jgi:hypothetical protein
MPPDVGEEMVRDEEGDYVLYMDVFPMIMDARRIQEQANQGFTRKDQVTAVLAPALPLIQRMAETYQQRREAYGPSEQKFADLALALFPDGLHLTMRSEWVRFGLFVQLMSKMSRYAANFYQGHIDSVHDMGPYAAMLEAEDRRIQHKPPFELRNTEIK